jgi:MFS family permease
VREPGAGSPEPGTQARSSKHGARGTEHEARGTEREARRPECEARRPEPGAGSPEFEAQSTEFEVRSEAGFRTRHHGERATACASPNGSPDYTGAIPQHLQIDPAASAVLPGLEPMAPGLWRGVLRHRTFRRVWFGAMVSSIGTWMEGLGVQWLMAEQTGSTVMLGALAAAQLGPMLLLGMFGGLAADRFERRKLLLLTQALMMLIAAALALASALGRADPSVLLALGLLNGVAMAFNTPAWQVLVPRLVPREELHRAIALQGMQFNLARVVGPALAGVLLAQTSATVLFALNAVSFVAVLAAIAGTPPAPAPPGPPPTARQQVGEALVFVFGRPGPRALFGMLVLLSALAAPMQRMLPLFVADVFRADETAYGLLLGLFGAGAVLGGLTLGRWPAWYPRHHLIPLALTLTGLFMTLFCSTRELAIGGVWIFAAGAVWIWAFSSMMTAVQLLVRDSMRGRVLSVTNMAMFGAMPIGSLLAALLGERLVDWLAIADSRAAAVQLGAGSMALLLTLIGALLMVFRTPEIDDPTPTLARSRSFWRGVTAAGHRPVLVPGPTPAPPTG